MDETSDAPQAPGMLTDAQVRSVLAGAVVLLDLNYTYVANSHDKVKPFTAQIDQETYRPWLDQLLTESVREDGADVVLITARPAMHQARTLQRIEALTGLPITLACFNIHGQRPPQAKQLALQDRVCPRFGLPGDPRRYVAIESNPATRAMYAQLGIPSLRVDDSGTGLVWAWATPNDR